MNVYGPYFTDKELNVSDAHSAERNNMLLLVKFGLNPIRKKYGPVIITSGYRTRLQQETLRSKGYNPSDTSQHLTGEAVDFVCANAKMRDVFEYIKSDMEWCGQLFYYTKKGHVHIALPRLDLAAQGRLYARILDE